MIPETIGNFIQKQSYASICCAGAEGPWCFSCFYAFDAEKGLLYYKSSTATKHSQIISENPRVAGTILPQTFNRLMVQGIQFKGSILDKQHPLVEKAPAYYYKNHPLALGVPGEVWIVQLTHIKMTDSTLGFGKKINWSRVGVEA